MPSFWINTFPLPPSINNQLMGGYGRLRKTPEARTFDRAIDMLRVRQAEQFRCVFQSFEPYLKDHVIRVDMFVVIKSDRVFTKTKQAQDWVKSIDQFNFQKSAHDALAKCITIDDKFFFAGNVEKIFCEKLYQEQIIFKLELMKPRSLNDIQVLQITERL